METTPLRILKLLLLSTPHKFLLNSRRVGTMQLGDLSSKTFCLATALWDFWMAPARVPLPRSRSPHLQRKRPLPLHSSRPNQLLIPTISSGFVKTVCFSMPFRFHAWEPPNRLSPDPRLLLRRGINLRPRTLTDLTLANLVSLIHSPTSPWLTNP